MNNISDFLKENGLSYFEFVKVKNDKVVKRLSPDLVEKILNFKKVKLNDILLSENMTYYEYQKERGFLERRRGHRLYKDIPYEEKKIIYASNLNKRDIAISHNISLYMVKKIKAMLKIIKPINIDNKLIASYIKKNSISYNVPI